MVLDPNKQYLLKPKEAAPLMGVSLRQFYNMAERNDLPFRHTRVGTSVRSGIRVWADDVEKWLETGERVERPLSREWGEDVAKELAVTGVAL